jgi:hypothetical protein
MKVTSKVFRKVGARFAMIENDTVIEYKANEMEAVKAEYIANGYKAEIDTDILILLIKVEKRG